MPSLPGNFWGFLWIQRAQLVITVIASYGDASNRNSSPFLTECFLVVSFCIISIWKRSNLQVIFFGRLIKRLKVSRQKKPPLPSFLKHFCGAQEIRFTREPCEPALGDIAPAVCGAFGSWGCPAPEDVRTARNSSSTPRNGGFAIWIGEDGKVGIPNGEGQHKVCADFGTLWWSAELRSTSKRAVAIGFGKVWDVCQRWI